MNCSIKRIIIIMVVLSALCAELKSEENNFILPSSSPSASNVSFKNKQYPQHALRCYAQNDGNKMVICPMSRNNFCVKEVVMESSRSDCGKTKEYPLDKWDRATGQCVYRKCAATCIEKNTKTFGGGQGTNGQKTNRMERTSFCCTTALCNMGTRPRAFSSIWGLVCHICIILFLLF